jgi:hypothetical protein
MKWNNPQSGDTRVRHKFILTCKTLPTAPGGREVTRCLEYAEWIEVFKAKPNHRNTWAPVCWADMEDSPSESEVWDRYNLKLDPPGYRKPIVIFSHDTTKAMLKIAESVKAFARESRDKKRSGPPDAFARYE